MSTVTVETLAKRFGKTEAVVDVCQKDNVFPLRVIALQQQIEDLEEDVYDFVLENQISIGNALTPIQIVAEDGDIYSFIPMISYGK